MPANVDPAAQAYAIGESSRITILDATVVGALPGAHRWWRASALATFPSTIITSGRRCIRGHRCNSHHNGNPAGPNPGRCADGRRKARRRPPGAGRPGLWHIPRHTRFRRSSPVFLRRRPRPGRRRAAARPGRDSDAAAQRRLRSRRRAPGRPLRAPPHDGRRLDRGGRLPGRLRPGARFLVLLAASVAGSLADAAVLGPSLAVAGAHFAGRRAPSGVGWTTRLPAGRDIGVPAADRARDAAGLARRLRRRRPPALAAIAWLPAASLPRRRPAPAASFKPAPCSEPIGRCCATVRRCASMGRRCCARCAGRDANLPRRVPGRGLRAGHRSGRAGLRAGRGWLFLGSLVAGGPLADAAAPAHRRRQRCHGAPPGAGVLGGPARPWARSP